MILGFICGFVSASVIVGFLANLQINVVKRQVSDFIDTGMKK